MDDFKITHTPCEVEFVGKLGTDLTVVNAARVSFGQTSTELTERDRKLIGFLAREQHYSPFRHCMIQVRIKAPEMTLRQAMKHVVGIEVTSAHPTKDHAWSEISTRYKVMDTVYVPPVWHAQHPSAKQCAAEPLDPDAQHQASEVMRSALHSVGSAYKALLALGVAREEARQILPLSFITEVFWTASLQAVHHFVDLRSDPHAQTEIRELAGMLDDLCTREFPVAYAALKAKRE